MMRRILVLVPAVLVFLAGYANGSKEVKLDDLDTDRDAAEFVGGVRVPGLYIDDVEVIQKGHLEVAGQPMNQITAMHMRTETEVTEENVVMTITRFAADENKVDVERSFDTGKPDEGDKKFKSLMHLVGVSEQTDLDENGDVQDSVFDRVSPVETVDNLGFSPTLQYGKMARLVTGVLPKASVRPNDTWDADFSLGFFGSVSGMSTLKGYKAFYKHDCAVITFQGTFTDMDLDKVMLSIGGDVNQIASSFELLESSLEATLFWDDESGFLRWCVVKVMATLGFPDPFIPSSTLSMPIEQTLQLTTKENN